MLILGDAVDRLRNGTEAREQQATATKIKMLALTEQNRAAIIEAGAVVPLIELLSHERVEVQEEAAAALRSLSVGQATVRQQIVTSGGLPPLLAMLDQPQSSPAVHQEPQRHRVEAQRLVRERQEQAAGLLKTLAVQPEGATAIVAAGGKLAVESPSPSSTLVPGASQ